MSDGTGISWADATWNPIVGCDKVSRGCDHCYAIRTAHRMTANPNPLVSQAYAGTEAEGEWTGKVNLLANRLDQPLRWRKPRRIFVNAQSDLFHKDVPDDFILHVFAVMARTPHHTYQVLTKRHGRMRSLLRSDDFRPAVEDAMKGMVAAHQPKRVWYAAWPLPNLWLGASVEDQATVDLRIPALLQTPAAARWISVEPLLGPVDLSRWLAPKGVDGFLSKASLDDEVREHGIEDEEHVSRAADLPRAHRQPPMALNACSIPPDVASLEQTGEARHDLLGGGVDRDSDGAPPLGTAPGVDGPLAVDHPRNPADRAKVGGDDDAGDLPLAARTARLDSGSLQAAPDGRVADPEALGDVHDRLPGGVGRRDVSGSDRGVRHAAHSTGIDWLICGGESGPGARPMHPAWARSLRDQCASAGVPFFFKQWGEHGQDGRRVGRRAAGDLLDGVQHHEWPTTERTGR